RLMGNSDMADPQKRSPDNRSGPDPRHMGKVNVAFCDGHVETMSLRDMGYVVRPDGSQAAIDPAADNKLFSGSGRNDNPPPALYLPGQPAALKGKPTRNL